MGIIILTVGKKKNDIYNSLFSEYIDRIKLFTKINIIYSKDFGKLKEEKNIIIKKESEILLKHIDNKYFNILLDIKGDLLNSEDFAKILEKDNIRFIIGGMFGVNENIKNSVNMKLSLSKMTLPHKLARIFLAEQIYRGLTINKKMRYHK